MLFIIISNSSTLKVLPIKSLTPSLIALGGVPLAVIIENGFAYVKASLNFSKLGANLPSSIAFLTSFMNVSG